MRRSELLQRLRDEQRDDGCTLLLAALSKRYRVNNLLMRTAGI